MPERLKTSVVRQLGPRGPVGPPVTLARAGQLSGGRGGRIVNDRMAASASDSDEILIARLSTGDHDAEVAFVRRFQFRVYGLARGLVRDEGLAEDIAQEAFLRAWRHASKFDPRRGSATTWLLTITRNVAIDALRRRQAGPVDPNLLSSLDLEAQDGSPDELAADNDAASRLRELIGQLPIEQRRVVVLAFFYGRTAREISISEGIPLGTAKTRIRAAMTKLRAALPAENPTG
jgi:RNA polymerase sigma-70 factor (ECF subfamily)